MKKRNLPKEKKQTVKHERDPIPWRYCLLALFCGLLLATGFFWAARQHFGAMDYGMKNAKLRRDIKFLKEEEGRLMEEKEEALNPAVIRQRGEKRGLKNLAVEHLAAVSAPPDKVAMIASPKASVKEKMEKTESMPAGKMSEEAKLEEKNKETKLIKNKSGIVKTVLMRPQIARK